MTTLTPQKFLSDFGRLKIEIVEPGTEIKFGGDRLAVTDQKAVKDGDTVYCTEAVYRALKGAAAKT